MLINIKDVWDGALSEHCKYLEDLIRAERDKLKSEHLRYLLEMKDEIIISGSPPELEQVIHFTNGLLLHCTDEEGELFFSECESLFDYESFSKKREKTYKKWNAYKLCQSSKYTLCPYCQQNFSFTVIGEAKGSFRPTLDHFYPKSKYPYLSLSLFNLVPSCYVCNSSLKGAKNFFYLRHLHPFSDEESVYFNLDILDYIRRRESKDFEMELNIQPQKSAALINSIQSFLLKERYEVHTPTLKIFIDNLDNWLLRDFTKFRDILGGHSVFEEQHALSFNISNYKNEFLGKIKKDLYEQMKALKTSNAT